MPFHPAAYRLLLLGALAGCASTANRPPPPLPAALALHPSKPSALAAVRPAELEARMRARGCHVRRPTVAAAALALGAQGPPVIESVRLDHGRTREGVRWFLLRDAANPSIKFCGVALFEVDGGTRIALTGVPRGRVTQAVDLVQSGEFLCRCGALAR